MRNQLFSVTDKFNCRWNTSHDFNSLTIQLELTVCLPVYSIVFPRSPISTYSTYMFVTKSCVWHVGVGWRTHRTWWPDRHHRGRGYWRCGWVKWWRMDWARACCGWHSWVHAITEVGAWWWGCDRKRWYVRFNIWRRHWWHGAYWWDRACHTHSSHIHGHWHAWPTAYTAVQGF